MQYICESSNSYFLEGGIFFLTSNEVKTYSISLSSDTQLFLEWYILYDDDG